MAKRISKELVQALTTNTGLRPPTIYAKIAEDDEEKLKVHFKDWAKRIRSAS